MAFDQNSIPKDLRPLNVVRTVPEDHRIATVTSSARPVEGFYGNPPRDGSPSSAQAVYYPSTVSESGFVGLGFAGNGAVPVPVPGAVQVPVPGVPGWVPRVVPLPPSGVLAAGGVDLGGSSFHSRGRSEGTVSDQASDGCGDDSVSGKKVKFLCSFGGNILPRPSDSALRYVGGQTRIISVRRDISFPDLYRKMVDIYGQNVVIKYQLPDEDLDALVSVSCPDDLENMMDEYEKLLERSLDGSAKLRVFLFSASEVDSVGMVHIGDWHDSGQKYVEAVNGYVDVTGRPAITRKESTASATSTHSSDVNGSEAVDSTARGSGEITGPPSTCVLSPRELNSTASQEALTRTSGFDPSPAVSAEASAVPPSMLVSNSGHSPSSANVENELAKIVTANGQQKMGYEMQQVEATIPAPSPYLHPYMDPQQETGIRSDYVQNPAQMGFPTQLLGTVAPVFAQQHISPTGTTHQQFFPAVHMTMVPSSHVSMNPNLVQPQQILLEPYPTESQLGQRIVHAPADPGYNAFHPPVPHTLLGGAYGWHQIPQTEHVAYSESYVPHQQALAPDNFPRFEDCYMCQKALPHAHSDTLARDQKESPASSDSRSIYHSLCLDDRGQPVSRAFAAGGFGESVVEQQGIGSPPKLVTNLNHEVGNPPSEGNRLAQNVEGYYAKDRIIHQRPENIEQPRIPVSQGSVGVTGGIQSPYGVLVGTIPQTSPDIAVQPVLASSQYQVTQESMMRKPTNVDVPATGGLPLQTSDYVLHESPKDISGNFPVSAPFEDNTKPVHDHLKQIDGRIENLRISPADVLPISEQSKSPTDNPIKEEILDNRSQQVVGREAYLDAAFSKPKAVLDANNSRLNDILPISSTEVPNVQKLQQSERYEVAQPPLAGDLGMYGHSKLGVNLVPDEILCNSAFSGVDSAQLSERNATVGEWKENAPRYHPNIVSGGIEAVQSDGSTLSSVSPSYRIGDFPDSSNSLFSNQDPWNLRHETHFPPPRPIKIQIKKESFGPRDASGENRFDNGELLMGSSTGVVTDSRAEDRVAHPSGNLIIDVNSEHSRPSKGSAEELIKQELQAVAEGVAASVLQSSLPSNPDLSGHGRSESPSTSVETDEVNNIDKGGVLNVDKIEEIKAKLPEKINFGFPISDGLGRLQIIKNSDLEELRELGSGTFGTVYHGKWRGTDVAIKRINDRCFAGKASEEERMRDDFWNEAINLADLHHPNVVAFYGVVLDGPGGSVATVTEYMVNGSLRNALQKGDRNLDKRKRLLIAMDVAFGMEYLHGKKIVHFDLKSDNLLVNLRDPHRPICKVGDLGLSKVKCQTLISGGVRGTLPWMAPELLNGSSNLVSEKVDVYSFGIVMWELVTGEEPYADLHYGAIIGGIVSNTLRPPVPESCDPDWKSLMERCWSAEPSERPSFTEIANELRLMASKLPPKGQNQQPVSSKQPQVKS
ncbi:RAF-like serine/threonine-protein kinase PRAF isoform X1 [Coffea arabica]|uniref:RAF-like serine/threonine-protein kinase PRAF isoform X1 n=1 Tax=Coffea arabica TaxID=13443 RepID=A0A6P6XHF4_COFAR|nr:uncharacterized protein LOC113742831 isoform X1 [Coffea arabica]